MNYKHPLTIQQQTEYLKKHKRVVYNQISEKEAQEILYTHNYINVITPFKYRFARKNKKHQISRDTNGCHIYDRDVEFKEYYNLYCTERAKYPKIYANIMKFEKLVSSIVSYEILISYRINNLCSFKSFTSILAGNIKSSNYKENIKEYMLKIESSLNKDIEEYKSPYIVLDHLSLNDTLTILVNSDKKIKKKCINEIVKRQEIVKATDEQNFYKLVSKIVRIRNCVCHNDSLEILLRYLSRKHKTLRRSSDRHSYAKLIKKLSE